MIVGEIEETSKKLKSCTHARKKVLLSLIYNLLCFLYYASNNSVFIDIERSVKSFLWKGESNVKNHSFPG